MRLSVEGITMNGCQSYKSNNSNRSNAGFFLSLVRMLESRFFACILICLSACGLHAQQLYIELPFEAYVQVDDYRSSDMKAQWNLEIADTLPHQVRIFSKGEELARDIIKFRQGESRGYILEETDLNRYRLFYRSNLSSQVEGYDVLTEVITSDRLISDILSIDDQVPTPQAEEPEQRAVQVIENLSTDSLDTSESYSEALERISSVEYEFERSKEILTWVELNEPNISELEGMVKLLAFDPSKYVLLQKAFEYCSEPENYHELQSVFQYDNYKNQFNTWLKIARSEAE